MAQNDTNIAEGDCTARYQMLMKVYWSLRIISGFLALFGNIITFYIIYSKRKNPVPSHILILMLAIADINSFTEIVLSLIILGLRQRAHEYPMLVVCRFREGLDAMCIGLNVVAVCCISVDRFVGIMRPLRYHVIVTMKRTIILVVALTFYVVVLFIYIAVKEESFKLDNKSCLFIANLSKTSATCILTHFVVFSCVTLILYIYIGSTACKKGKENHAFRSPMNSDHRSPQIKTTLVMLRILGVYFACYAPVCIFLLVRNEQASCVVFYVSLTIYYCNMWLNPLVYALKLPDLKLICKRRARNSIDPIQQYQAAP